MAVGQREDARCPAEATVAGLQPEESRYLLPDLAGDGWAAYGPEVSRRRTPASNWIDGQPDLPEPLFWDVWEPL